MEQGRGLKNENSEFPPSLSESKVFEEGQHGVWGLSTPFQEGLTYPNTFEQTFSVCEQTISFPYFPKWNDI